MIIYHETPVTELKDDLTRQMRVRLLIKREDLNHPQISGNKWWKLKYNLEMAYEIKNSILLTFGGAYSNHIYATASAAYEIGLRSIGVIRGEEHFPLNPTLQFAVSKKMLLHYVSRADYGQKEESEFIRSLRDKFGNFYLIPEGGTNDLAIKGCKELGTKLQSEIQFDYLCVAVGTGGTMQGIAAGASTSRILGFPVIKDGSGYQKIIHPMRHLNNWELIESYHFGGYAKFNAQLLQFIEKVKKESHIPLDRIYTGKLLYGVYDLIAKGYFGRGSTILVLHSGGLQGTHQENKTLNTSDNLPK